MVSYAVHVMRRIVIDHIRKRQTVRHGGEHERVSYETLQDLHELRDDQVLRMGDTLRDLAKTDARLAELVELRSFAGLTFTDIAALRDVSVRTVQRDWDKARMLLFDALSG